MDENKSVSRADRLAALRERQRQRVLRSFLVGLLVGQLAIVAVNLGVPVLIRLCGYESRLDPERVPVIVFVGIAGGMGIIGALLFLMLAFSGIVALFRKGSLARGARRVGAAALAYTITTAALAGSAFLMMPDCWTGSFDKVRSVVVETMGRSRPR